jgi:16S rRNA (adenine1518-N6/adenine1519-N6)-dimethyltransferase
MQRLKIKFAELGIEPKRSLGQNFLVDDAVIDKILLECDCKFTQKIIEVGPGLGALTDLLLQKIQKSTQNQNVVSKLILLELDRGLATYWRQSPVAEVIETDALKWNWAEAAGALVVGNLPYQISASLVVELSTIRTPPKKLVFMFQKEVAQRILAPWNQSEFGMLSALAQSFWKIRKLCDAGPHSFFPPPKIASRVLIFEYQPNPEFQNWENFDPKEYLRFLKRCFQHPRQMLMGALVDYSGWPKSTLETVMSELSIKSNVRPHQISVPNYAQLFKKLASQ